jgi:hypothetical protein
VTTRTEKNNEIILHPFLRETYVKGFGEFIRECAKDSDIAGVGSLAAELLEEARRRNERGIE